VAFGLMRAGSLALAFSGRIYNADELRGSLGADAPGGADPAALALALYLRFGREFARRIHGPFSFALVDASSGLLLAGRDHLGIEILYWHEDDRRVAVSSDLGALRRFGGASAASPELDSRALARFLLSSTTPGPRPW
jgi:asparagine synthase (glutamine-hydrolysing)